MIGATLRETERRQLLAALATLGSPDPASRAEAALKVSNMMARKGLSWSTLLPATEAGNGGDSAPPPDWRAEVVALLARPDLDPVDRLFLHKMAGWRAPGADGVRRLREIGERVAAGP